MSALRRMSRLAALPLAPVLYPQAKALRRKTPILPDAEGGPTALPYFGAGRNSV